MLDAVYEECGIAACVDVGAANADGNGTSEYTNAAQLIPAMLLDMQNRGQLASGITRYDPESRSLLRTHKALGGVNQVFHLYDKARHRALMETMQGRAAIGHLRYSTSGADDVGYAQPLERAHGKTHKWFSFCFNGNIANHQELTNHLVGRLGYHLVRPDSDTELWMHLLAFHQRGDKALDWVTAFKRMAKRIDGAWSLLLLSAAGDLVAARDPQGIKPLCWGRLGRYVLVASESIALTNRGVREVHDVQPGTLLWVKDGMVTEVRFAPAKKPKHCFFEWVYFANVASVIDQAGVYQARSRLGQALAELEQEPVGDDAIVVPVPDTSKACGDAFAFKLGIPSIEGLVRNRYVGRTFIETEDRAAKVRRKFVALRGVMEGKDVFLVDDSIVRSTTLTYLIDYIREEGRARSVHVRIACPPIMGPCFYGIDMSSIGELFATRFLDDPQQTGPLPQAVRDQMAQSIGADSLNYLPIDALADAIGLANDHLCLACVTRQYPTKAGNAMFALAKQQHRSGAPARRRTCS